MARRKHHPPAPVHIAGTQKGEEAVRARGREPGRGRNERCYRTARDSTGINPRDPIDPRMPCIPPA